MVLEGKITELLQNQASRFLRGFSADQLRLGVLSGCIELQRLSFNPEPIDELLRETESPFCVKAGLLTSAVVQVSVLKGEVELVIDGLTLVLAPCCRWLARDEVRSHRANEMQKLEFVHMRSQSQRRNLEHEMFRKLFADYLSRVKITVRNIHIRVEIDGKLDAVDPSCRPQNVAAGFLLGSCEVIPAKPSGDNGKLGASQGNEVLLAEGAELKDFALYHEGRTSARLLIPSATYFSTTNHPLGVFGQIKQEDFIKSMAERWQSHVSAPRAEQLVPPTALSIHVALKSKPLRIGGNVDACLAMEIHVSIPGDTSQLNLSSEILEHLQWYYRRSADFSLWQYLHLAVPKPSNAATRWKVVRAAQALKRRIYRDRYTLREALTMRSECKEYIRLYKKKFNGPESVVPWRQGMPGLATGELERLTDVELKYPADHIVNFRLMAHAELRTEMALNKVHCLGQTSTYKHNGAMQGGPNGLSPYRQDARELTQLERLHLHGQHGYGINIYRGVPAPPSSIKIHVDFSIPHGMWWVCRSSKPAPASDAWAVAIDCVAQPVRAVLSDNVVDASVFATLELPAAPVGQRSLSVLCARSAAAFSAGSPGRRPGESLRSGGSGAEEWCAVLELDGAVYCCSQFRTLMAASMGTPWDIYLHLSCGDELQKPAADVEDIKLDYGYPRNVHEATSGSNVLVREEARVHVRIPGFLAAGQFGGMLRGSQPKSQSESVIAWLARCISVTRNIALLRLHTRLPPLVVESMADESRPHVCLPRFDGACHLEHGGLLDGFIVGLHSLRHFFACLLAATGPSINEQPTGYRVALSLEPLVRTMPPLTLIAGSFASALGLALTSRKHGSANSDAALLALMRRHNLLGIFKDASNSSAWLSRESPLASLSLLLVIMATVSGRRSMWDYQNDMANSMVKVSELHGLFGTALRSLLLMGVPLHPQCLSLAAWAGSCELLEAIKASIPSTVAWPPRGLLIWAVRGAYVNIEPRQEAVVRLLIQQRAKIDEQDREGWSLLEWASWSGAESLVTMALRTGMLPPMCCAAEPVAMEPSDAASSQWPPSPLTLAVASRSPSLVASLLRAACDPHVSPTFGHGGPLLLAVQKGEYEIACQLLKCAPFVAVEAALSSVAEYTTSGSVDDDEDDASLVTCSNLQATMALMDSFKRFARAIAPRGGEDIMNSMMHNGIRTQSLGAHPDEGLYAPGKAPFQGVLHPLLLELPRPKHRVGYELRPQAPPHWSLMRGTSAPWCSAYRFIESCLQHGFRPDGGVMTQALPTLPADAKRVVQKLIISTTSDPNNGHAGTSTFDTVRALRHFKLLDLDSPSKSAATVDQDSRNTERCLAKSPILSQSIDEGILPERVAEALTVCLESYTPLPSIGDDHEAEEAFDMEANAHVFTSAWAPDRLLLAAEPNAASLPSVRVVILGPPRVGKTTVSQHLIATLNPHGSHGEHIADEDGWLHVHSGSWPRGKKPTLMVNIWDGCAAPLPGMLTRVADPAAAVLFLWVVDAELGSPPKDEFVHELLSTTNSSAPRRAATVFNEFADGPSTPRTREKSSPGPYHVVHGSMKSREDVNQLQRTFALLCEEIQGELLSHPAVPDCIGSRASTKAEETGTGRSVNLPMAWQLSASDPAVKSIKELGWRFRGDASLSDPAAVTWAWAALNASMGFLAEGSTSNFLAASGPCRCDGSLVLMERLLRVLDTAKNAQRSCLTAPALVKALSDLGLICPIPQASSLTTMQTLHSGCTWALVPDFARQAQLTNDQISRLSGSPRGSKRKQDESGANACLAVRILWDSPGFAGAPSPRRALRDFLSHGALSRGGVVAGNSYSIDVCNFLRLHSGPAGAASDLDSDDFAPGFLLAFDFTPACMREDTELTPTGPCEGRAGNVFVKPPSSIKDMTPSGRNSDMHPAALNGNLADDPLEQRTDLTTVILGASCGSNGSSRKRGTPFWDLYCHGKHAQWAMRAFFGSGACGPIFSNLECSGKFDMQNLKSSKSKPGNWKLPAPTCVISCRATSQVAESQPVRSLTEYESLAVSWLFNGSEGSGARAGLLNGTPESSPNPFAACCAALCGKSASAPSSDGVQFNDSTYGLGACADFHAALLARNWRMMAEVLQECLDAGVEMWAMCHAALVRLVHDMAAAVAGSRGRSLPILCLTGTGSTAATSASSRQVALVPDGPSPIISSSQASRIRPQQRSASLNPGPGLDIWLRICRPAALWGAAAGVCPSQELTAGNGVGVCGSVVEAIQIALQTRLTEEHVSEVCEAVDKLIEMSALIRRANGAWAAVPDVGSFLL